MEEVKMENARYIYIHDVHKVSSPSHAVDTHHIVRRRNAVTYVLVYLSALLLNAYAFFLFLFKDNSIFIVIWSLLVSVLLVKLLIWNPVVKGGTSSSICIFAGLSTCGLYALVVMPTLSGLCPLLYDLFLLAILTAKRVTIVSAPSESIVIMPAFGVQFETHYGSGKINRCFVPAGKILKPVLNECVTPVTCYWCLSLLIRGQEELMLVFKAFQPPIKMLAPIWKALCAAIDSKGSSGALKDDMR